MRPDGEVRWVHRRGQVRRGPHGRAESVLGVALDITERKAAEDANARLAAIALARRRCRRRTGGRRHHPGVESGSGAHVRLFGRRGHRPVGTYALSRGVRRQSRADSRLARRREGEHVRYEGVRVRKDGGHVEIAGVAAPVRGKADGIVGVAAVLRDVGEHKRMEQKLVEALAQVLKTQQPAQARAGWPAAWEPSRWTSSAMSTTWSDEIYAQFGIDRSTPIATEKDIARFIHPDDREDAL